MSSEAGGTAANDCCPKQSERCPRLQQGGLETRLDELYPSYDTSFIDLPSQLFQPCIHDTTVVSLAQSTRKLLQPAGLVKLMSFGVFGLRARVNYHKGCG